MKNIKIGFLLLAAIISFTPLAETKAQSVSISFSAFHQELSPYGRWMNNPRFGQVWINYDANFRPYYTDGHWEYTNYGWSWISDYDWGWAPFHYGRWEYDPFYGWMWIPGYEWGAAWVSWSSYDDYYGWAPLGYGNNINISFGSIPYNNWTFIPRRNICDRNLNRYYVSHRQDNRFRNAVVINNYYNGRGNIGRFVRGPERREVERYTGNNIQERRIDYTDRRLNRNNATSNNSNNSNNTGIRNADGTVPGNNGNPGIRNNPAQNDANTGNNRFETTKPVKENRVKRNDDQQNNVPQQNNNRGNRDIKPNPNTTTTQPVYENNKPNREVKRMPPVKEDTDARTPQNENRNKRYDNQQNNVPQRQQNTRPVPQQNTRPVPQQQREPVMQPQQQRQPAMQPQQQNNRTAPQQQRQPAVQPQQQRSSDNRVDGNAAGKNMQQSNGNSQRQNTKNGKSNIQQ